MFDETPGGRYRVNGVLVDAEGKPLKGEAAEEAQSPPEGGMLDGVQFASAAARTAAEAEGLTAADFEGRQGSGSDGFTKPDVTALAEALFGKVRG